MKVEKLAKNGEKGQNSQPLSPGPAPEYDEEIGDAAPQGTRRARERVEAIYYRTCSLLDLILLR